MAAVYLDLLNAVKAELAVVTNIPPVTIREDAFILDSDKVPFVLLAALDPLQIKRKTFGGGIHYAYPIRVILVYGDNRTVSGNAAANLQLFEDVRGVLNRPKLAGVTGQYDTEFETEPLSKLQQEFGTNYRLRGYKVTYITAERRSSG